jgi:hypothetical protein
VVPARDVSHGKCRDYSSHRLIRCHEVDGAADLDLDPSVTPLSVSVDGDGDGDIDILIVSPRRQDSDIGGQSFDCLPTLEILSCFWDVT